MSRAGCGAFSVLLLTLSVVFGQASSARADDTEHRDFSVFVNGKESGASRMLLVQKDDGTSYMSATLEVKFRQLVVDFTLKIETQEWWKQGRLISMKTIAIENGKRTEVNAGVDRDLLRLRVNNRESVVNPEVWTTSYWKLADSRFHNKQVPILEVDSGKELVGELKYQGPKKLKVGGDFIDCYHFVVSTNGGAVEIWYDRFHRLVRQESTESGHKIIVQLNSVKR